MRGPSSQAAIKGRKRDSGDADSSGRTGTRSGDSVGGDRDRADHLA